EGLVILTLAAPGAGEADGGGDLVARILREGGVLVAGLGVIAAEEAQAGLLEGGAVGTGEGDGGQGEQDGAGVSHRGALARVLRVCCYLTGRGGKTQAGRSAPYRRGAPG